MFSKAGFVSGPEAREEVAHGEIVCFLAREKSALDEAADGTVIQHSFAPSGADNQRKPFTHGCAVGYYLTLLRS